MNSIINQKIRIKDFVPSIITPKQGPNKKLKICEGENCLVLRSNMSTVIADKFMTLNEDDFIAIGLYLAEGEKYINKGRTYNHSGEISFANNDLDSTINVVNLLEKFGITKDNLRWKMGLNIKYSQNADKAREYWIKSLKLDPKKARPRWLYITGDENTKLTISSNEMGYIQIFL